MNIATRLKELGIVLPTPPPPVAAYVPTVLSGSMLYISGQIPNRDSQLLYTGKLGEQVTMEAGQEAARLCALNLLAQAQAALGSLDRIERVVKLTGFVACAADFYAQPQIINAASNLMQEVFGEAGRHARSAVGAPALPLNAAVEIEGIFAVT
jgi:enamine deaminase RidA (YjgF/YER057c/UK114 family)